MAARVIDDRVDATIPRRRGNLANHKTGVVRRQRPRLQRSRTLLRE